MKFDFYADPGHGWLKVPRGLITVLGIENYITSFSYATATHLYLEEDCDMSVFFKAYEDTYGKKPEYNVHHSNRDSKVRSYPCYNAPNPIEDGYMYFLGYKTKEEKN